MRASLLVLLVVAAWLGFGGRAHDVVPRPEVLIPPGLTAEGRRCYDRYGNITFVPESEVGHHIPTVLLSFPGSGNTWIRLLIEYATGHYSGALDVNDAELQSMLVGEHKCGQYNSINKAHPGDLFVRGDKLKNGSVVESIRFVYKWQRKKCIRGGVHTFTRFLLLTRDPYEAIFADFQRHISGSHAGTMNDSYIDPASPLHREWVSRAMRAASDNRDGMEDLLSYLLLRPATYPALHVRYDRLTNASTRKEELSRMLAFLNYTASEDRAACAFTLAETPRIKRTKRLDIDRAYLGVRPKLVCEMWPMLRSFASNFSYPMWQPKSGAVAC